MAQTPPRFDKAHVVAQDRRLDPLIEACVPPGARVMDLGCGNGELLERLITNRGINARGVEISSEGVKACIEKGLSVYQGDIDDGLGEFDDQVLDVVILNLTLSMLYEPRRVLTEAARIGKRVIVSFYNIAFAELRQAFARSGSVQDLSLTGEPWYASEHIHLFSVVDFDRLIADLGLRPLQRHFVDRDFVELDAEAAADPQSHAFAAVYVLERG